MQQISTYHLDQNIRGRISKGHMSQHFLEKYYPKKYEAILPLAVLEYAGIQIKQNLFFEINPPPLSESLDLQKIKEYFDSQIEEKLPKNSIEEKLRERLQHDNEYAKLFAKKCLDALSSDGFYDLIVNQLSWDRFSQMKWINNNSKIDLRAIRRDIAKLIIKHDHLYVLRHFKYFSENLPDFPLNENQKFLDIIKKIKLKPNMDIGDCELIHVAINGQSSGDLSRRKPVDCYSGDNAKEIKRRLIACLYFYEILESAPVDSNYQFDSTYCSNIYIIDERGQQKEEIKVSDYMPNKVLMRINKEDSDTLSLLVR